MRSNYFRYAVSCGYAVLVVITGCSSDGQDALVMSDTQTVADPQTPQDGQTLSVNPDELDTEQIITNDGPEGNSHLTLFGINYPLDVALGDIRGVLDDHYLINLILTNGTLVFESIVVDGQEFEALAPGQSTAVVHADIYSPGSSFVLSTYTFVASQDSIADNSGVGYFTNAYVGVDGNLDGVVSEDERRYVIEGIIDFAGSQPSDIALNFALTLDSGESVAGVYTGLFDFTAR